MHIHHDTTEQIFRTENGAFLSYSVENGRHLLDHTEVPPELRGQGVAGKLAKAALDHARKQGWRIVPACSYIEVYLRRHPEYADLVGD